MLGMTRTKLAFVALILSASTQALPLSTLFIIVALFALIPWKSLSTMIDTQQSKNSRKN